MRQNISQYIIYLHLYYMHKHGSRGQTLQKITSPLSPKCRKLRKWGFGPIHMKGKRNRTGNSMPLYPPFPIKYQHPQAPNFFWPSHERGMSVFSLRYSLRSLVVMGLSSTSPPSSLQVHKITGWPIMEQSTSHREHQALGTNYQSRDSLVF